MALQVVQLGALQLYLRSCVVSGGLSIPTTMLDLTCINQVNSVRMYHGFYPFRDKFLL